MPTQKTLKVLTYNLKFRPGKLFFREDFVESRARSFTNLFLKGSEYDIICLQEVFDEDARKILVSKFNKLNFYIASRADGNDIRQDSGLFIASRYPIVLQRFHAFRHSVFPSADFFSSKGVLGVKIQLPFLGPEYSINVFNTHIQANEERFPVETYEATRLRQILEIRTFMYDFLARNNKIPQRTFAALLGDFNISEKYKDQETNEYRNMKNALGDPIDVYRTLSDQNGYTYPADKKGDPVNNKKPKTANRRIDYIWVFDDLKGFFRNEKLLDIALLKSTQTEVKKFAEYGPKVSADFDALSDHYGVEATFSF